MHIVIQVASKSVVPRRLGRTPTRHDRLVVGLGAHYLERQKSVVPYTIVPVE